jgi:hypothetical protein
MEEKEKENTQTNQEEINLFLTFNPEEMQKKIGALSEEIKQLKYDNCSLHLMLTTAQEDLLYLQKKIPKPLLTCIQDWLLEIFGGNYEN